MGEGYTIEYDEKVRKECSNKTKEVLDQLPPYCTSFIMHKMDTTQPRTRQAYVEDIALFFSYLIATNPSLKNKSIKDIELSHLEQLNANDFDEYLAWLSEYKYHGKIYKNERSSKKRKLASLRTFFSFLYKRDFISQNTCAKADLPVVKRKDNRKIRILEDYEKTLLFDELDKEYEKAKEKYDNQETVSPAAQRKLALIQRDILIIKLILATGVRVSEVCAMNCSDINFELNRINIIRKGGEYDDVCFSDDIKDLLYDYITDTRLVLQPNGQNEDALFISSKHTRISPRAIEQKVAKYTDASLGSKNGITPHKLRATFGTNYYYMTNDIYATKEVMGHSSVDVTAEYYAKQGDSAKERMKDIIV